MFQSHLQKAPCKIPCHLHFPSHPTPDPAPAPAPAPALAGVCLPHERRRLAIVPCHGANKAPCLCSSLGSPLELESTVCYGMQTGLPVQYLSFLHRQVTCNSQHSFCFSGMTRIIPPLSPGFEGRCLGRAVISFFRLRGPFWPAIAALS